MAPREKPNSTLDSTRVAGRLLRLAISPYHLSTRELTATVALTLADEAITMVPEPVEGHSREDIRRAVERVPRLLRVLEAWRWSGPIWRAGLIAGSEGEDRVFASIARLAVSIAEDASLAELGGAAAPPDEAGDAADRWLDALCSDLLRGGPDPRLATTATAALDDFASTRGYVSVRGSTESVAQRAEARLMRRAFSVAIPVMSRAAGGRILELRGSLGGELRELRDALIDSWPGSESGSDAGARLSRAAETYSTAFERWFARVARDDENAERTMRTFISVTGAEVRADAAIVCARAAIRTTARATGRATKTAATGHATASRQLRTLIIRPMNVRPA